MDALLAARTLAPGALRDEAATCSPLAAYYVFKLAQLGFHAALDVLYPAGPRHAFTTTDDPTTWAAQWTGPTPVHQDLLARVVPFWAARDDGALGCIRVCPWKATPSPIPRFPSTHVPLEVTRDGVPSLLRRFLSASPLLDVRLQHGALTARAVLALAFDLVPRVPPAVCTVEGATETSRRLADPLMVHDGRPAAVWSTRTCAVRLCHNRELQQLGVSSLSCTVPLALDNGGDGEDGGDGGGEAGTLVLVPLRVDAGMVPCGWTTGTLAQRVLGILHAEGTPVTHEFDAVVVPWAPVVATKTQVPALEGIVHAQHVDGSGSCCIEGVRVNATWTWRGSHPRHPLSQPRRILTPVDASCVLMHLLVVRGIVVAALFSPPLLPLSLSDAAAPPPSSAIDVAACEEVIPWGRQ